MRKNTLLFTFLAFLGLLLSPQLYGQDCISGIVYSDLNDSGTQDVGEMGLVSVSVIAIGADGTVLTTSSAMDGYYEFCDMAPQDYYIYPELDSPGLIANPHFYNLNFATGQSIPNQDFGIVNDAELGVISGRVFVDLNANGIKENNEPAGAGIQVTLNGANLLQPLVATVDDLGYFTINRVPEGAYLLSVGPALPNTSYTTPIEIDLGIAAGEVINTIRFIMEPDPGLALVRDFVCYDLDANGEVDPDLEPGIPNTVVEAVNGNGQVVATTTTDPNGLYSFIGLEPQDYNIRVLFNADDYEPTTPTDYDIVGVNDEVVPGGPFYFQPLRRRFRCGMVANTFGGWVSNNRVLAVKDIRDRSGAPVGVNSDWPRNPPFDIDNPDWRNTRMGDVYGIAIDADYNVYVSSTDIFYGAANNVGPAQIYRIDPFTGAVTDYVGTSGAATVVGSTALFNTGAALGNLCSNPDDRLLYVTNREDGTLNVVADFTNVSFANGEILQVYDPDFGDPNGEQNVWGIAYNSDERRVYFARDPVAGGNAEVYSIAVDAAGLFTGTEQLEFDVRNRKVADLAFSQDNSRILMGERGSAHNSAVFQRLGSTLAWGPPSKYYVGEYGNGDNSSGGVDYAFESFMGDEPAAGVCDSSIVATGNALIYEPGNRVYGFAIIPSAGNLQPLTAWPPDAIDYARINSVLVDSDLDILVADKGYMGDVEIFDCECPEGNCASDNGLELIPSLGEQGELDCCLFFDYVNSGNETVFGIQLTLLDGVEFFPGYTVDPGHFTPNYSTTSMTITPNGFGPMANGVNSILDFCLTNISAVPQYMVVEYLGQDYQPICTDTLTFDCVPPAPCMEVLVDSLVCDTAGYKYTIDLQVPIDNDFPDGIGYIEFNLTQALPAGVSITPTNFSFSPALGPGDQTTLMLNINTSLDLFGDSLCFILTAHDDEEERLCCFLMEACIPFPSCPDPCDDVNATVIPAYQGEAAVCCDGPPLEYTWLQDLIGDCTALPCGAEVSCCTFEGQQVIVVQDDPELCTDALGTVYDCAGGIIFQFGGIGGINLDLFEQLENCRLIYDCYNPNANSECCFDLLLTDTFTFDPNLFTAVQTTIITPGVSFSGQSTLQALLNGWSITEVVPQQDLIWTHNSGITPNGVDDYLFTFCVEGTTSTDSIYVAVDWLSQDSVVCQDTVAVFCPDCLQIVDEELSCVTDAAGNQTYLYEFSFINGSAFDVNAVSVSDIANPNDTILNAGVFQLPGFVPPGATYNGTIPVNIAGGIDTACFEIVLRQIIGDSINISCCYVTHCVPLPPCDELPQVSCPDPDQVDQQFCLDIWEPVCGCDGQTYSNSCYAENAGVIFYTPGPCDDQFDPTVNVSLGLQLEPGVGVRLNWMLADDPAGYDYFVLRGQWPNENGFTYVTTVPVDGTQQYSFLHPNTMEGINRYQVLAINNQGQPVASNIEEIFLQNMEALQTTLFTYPVPARDLVYVTANRNGDATIELTGTDGKVHQVQQATFGGAPVPVETTGVSDGVFIISVRFDDGETAHQRVVKLK